jgi:hypothetical protein
MSPLILAWLAEAGLITYRVHKTGRPAAAGGYKIPWPSDFVATFVIYGALAAIAEIGPGAASVAALTGWGLVLATGLNLVDPQLAAQTPSAQPAQPIPQGAGQ